MRIWLSLINKKLYSKTRGFIRCAIPTMKLQLYGNLGGFRFSDGSHCVAYRVGLSLLALLTELSAVPDTRVISYESLSPIASVLCLESGTLQAAALSICILV